MSKYIRQLFTLYAIHQQLTITTNAIIRNWDTDFGRQGVSKNPCSDVYPGKVPFSENNTKAMSDFLSKNLR